MAKVKTRDGIKVVRFSRKGGNLVSQKMRHAKSKKSEQPVSEEFVKNAVIKWLSQTGWQIITISGARGKGVDLKARKGGCYFLIETKGAKTAQGNEVAFVYGFPLKVCYE